MQARSIARALSRRIPFDEDAGGAVQAAVSLLITPRRRLLLIRRALHPKDPWSGQIGLPGGTREACDRDLLETVIRETEEETGIVLESKSLLGRLDDFRPRRKSLPDILIRPFVFGLKTEPRTRCSDEVQYCLWAPVAALVASRRERTVLFEDETRPMDSYLAGEGELVWGITARILSGFFAALKLV